MTRVSAMLLARASCVALLRRVHRGGCDHSNRLWRRSLGVTNRLQYWDGCRVGFPLIERPLEEVQHPAGHRERDAFGGEYQVAGEVGRRAAQDLVLLLELLGALRNSRFSVSRSPSPAADDVVGVRPSSRSAIFSQRARRGAPDNGAIILKPTASLRMARVLRGHLGISPVARAASTRLLQEPPARRCPALYLSGTVRLGA